MDSASSGQSTSATGISVSVAGALVGAGVLGGAGPVLIVKACCASALDEQSCAVMGEPFAVAPELLRQRW